MLKKISELLWIYVFKVELFCLELRTEHFHWDSSRHLPGDPSEAANITAKKDLLEAGSRPATLSPCLRATSWTGHESRAAHFPSFIITLLSLHFFRSGVLSCRLQTTQDDSPRLALKRYRGGTQLTPAHTSSHQLITDGSDWSQPAV